MKKLLAACIAFLYFIPVYAMHIRGGELSYKYVGPGTAPNSSIYFLRLKLYIDCNANAPGQNETVEPFTIFNRSTGAQVYNISVDKTSESLIQYDPNSNPCITNP